MIKYTPKHFVLYGIFIYCLLLLVGPYNYHFKNIHAIIYLVIAYLFLFAGIYSSKFIVASKLKIKTNFFNIQEISTKSENVLIIVEVISFICFLIYFFTLNKNISNEMSFMSGDYRDVASQGSALSKIAFAGCNSSIGVYIIVKCTKTINNKFLKIMCRYLYWLPAVTNLLVGARWSL